MESTLRPPSGPLDPSPLLPLVRRMTGDEKHDAAAGSTLPVMWALFAHVLRVEPTAPTHPDRDRFLVSKGHGPMAYYAALAWRGFFPHAWLDGFLGFESPLGAHPDRALVPGVEISSGSLGHGLPMAAGVAWALRAKGQKKPRVFCLLGDGELDEGSNQEAIAFAARDRLGALVAIVVDNHSASLGWPGGIAARFAAEGWRTTEVEGSEGERLVRSLDQPPGEAPRVVVVKVAPKEQS